MSSAISCDDPGAVGGGHRLLGVGDRTLQGDAHLLLELAVRHVHVVELRPEGLDELGVHHALEVEEGVGRRLAFLRAAAAVATAGTFPASAGAAPADGGAEDVVVASERERAAARRSVRLTSGLPQS